MPLVGAETFIQIASYDRIPIEINASESSDLGRIEPNAME